MTRKYDPDIHHRRSIRLKDYDYSAAGVYFITICTQARECLFGEVLDGEMKLNDAGRMVELILSGLPSRFSYIEIDSSIVMPNHPHTVLIITDTNVQFGSPQVSVSLSNAVGAFKSITTLEYIQGVSRGSWRLFQGKLWQRNYYEHIIRNEQELNAIREYISNNPLLWLEDKNHPYFSNP